MASKPRTTGAAHFDPNAFFTSWTTESLPKNNQFRTSIISAFDLPANDSYVYHAVASVNLTQVQEALNHGGSAGLHAWYLDDNGTPLPPPPPADITAYTSIFAPHTITSKALTSLAANAKKGSLRVAVAAHLQSQRLLPPQITVPRAKQHINPYYDFWAWSCQALEWAGPENGTANVSRSHHVLPVFMHHFGCVVPSYESLEVIKQIARGRTVVDLGSGNGYWTYMLRRLGVSVQAVDNLQSQWRTVWIGDTVVKNGDRYLKEGKGCKEMVLLLVYPIVGAEFTERVIEAYQGDTICVVGTQNGNGYTAFKDRTIETYMEERKDFTKTVQIPLPSFAGKDEALFIFEKRDPTAI